MTYETATETTARSQQVLMDHALAQYGPARDGYEPPTSYTWTTLVQHAAQQALDALESWRMVCMMDTDYYALCAQAADALLIDAQTARELGRAVQAARDALRDMAREDARAFVLEGVKSVREALTR